MLIKIKEQRLTVKANCNPVSESVRLSVENIATWPAQSVLCGNEVRQRRSGGLPWSAACASPVMSPGSQVSSLGGFADSVSEIV